MPAGGRARPHSRHHGGSTGSGSVGALAKDGEAAILQMLVKVLPEVVGAAAAPLSAVDKMTVISTDGAG